MTWNIDTAHSHVDFSVRHLGISTVRGRFKTFGGAATTDAAGTLVGFTADIDPASIETGVEQRDAHLRSPDFFNVAEFPRMRFESTRVRPIAGRRYEVEGTLAMRGASKPLTLEVELTDETKDPWGNNRIGATASGRISRKDWGLTWNQALETGGFVVSDEVKIALEVEGTSAN